ncbi:prefoldin subunit 5-like protein [Dinothrombium tinctorium]|uniref:Prefoldin subunit 5-like protein n=1 Tax=Dinothrombium tinctorium TaxID=1965070 RepID=A0A3S3Q4N7_9ACAR|nr:prefoldin subunit 5-like protein [Dinothrombium tinctorium]RWS03337.1 prefoldin subunit 5-like protein [Dinothrombium tinctorium]RWS06454.1 prefoldin subunit 5-like protein [Dinothrombium tinctorium]
MTPELNMLQLSSAKQQLDQEMELLASSIQQLQAAKSKYEESEQCVIAQKNVSENNEILVPLTGSMYVIGKVKDADKFMVDIGAGYYVEKNGSNTVEYFKRKVKFLNEQIEKYTKLLQEKIQMRDSVLEALQFRQQHLLAANSTNLDPAKLAQKS